MTDIYGITSTVVATIAGGFIAGICSLKATKLAHKHQIEISDKNETNLEMSLLQAIHDELETVYNRYYETMGKEVKELPENEPLNFYYPLVSDYFSVYHGNSFLIGKIKDAKIRKAIIKTYTVAKGLVDSFRLNNDIVQKLENWNFVYEETQLEVHRIRVEACVDALKKYASVLKQADEDFKREVGTTTKMLSDAIKN